MVYNLYTTVNHSLAIVDIKDGSNRIFDYFILGEGDGGFLNHARPLATAQSGYTPDNIVTTDYINASIGIPIFSQRFKDELGAEVANDLDLVECTVKCRNQDFTFYLGKIKTLINLVDRERSLYRTLTDGTPRLAKATYLDSFEQSFYIARDKEYKQKSVVSEAFKQLVEARGLRINFLSAV